MTQTIKLINVNAAARGRWDTWDKRDYNVQLEVVSVAKYWPTWKVYKDGVFLGYLRKAERTWEREIKGKRYVAARGTCTAWYISKEGGFSFRGHPYDTRNGAIRELVNWRENARF